jgi:hypothetical protein
MAVAVIESSLSISASAPESTLEVSRHLTELLAQAETQGGGDELPDNFRQRIRDIVEILRRRVGGRVERDPRSLFELDERLAERIALVTDAGSCQLP